MLLFSASGVDEFWMARENWLVATAFLHDNGKQELYDRWTPLWEGLT